MGLVMLRTAPSTKRLQQCSSCSRTRPLVGMRWQHSVSRQHGSHTAFSPQLSFQEGCRAMSSDTDGADQEFCVQMQPAAPGELERDREWISSMISTWLDEEWTPLEVHQQLGEAAGAAYVSCRQQGDDDMASLVLSLSNELLAFNYRETFVNAFEVANKVVEMLMMRSGIDVCCTSDEDMQRLERVGGNDSTQ